MTKLQHTHIPQACSCLSLHRSFHHKPQHLSHPVHAIVSTKYVTNYTDSYMYPRINSNTYHPPKSTKHIYINGFANPMTLIKIKLGSLSSFKKKNQRLPHRPTQTLGNPTMGLAVKIVRCNVLVQI